MTDRLVNALAQRYWCNLHMLANVIPLLAHTGPLVRRSSVQAESHAQRVTPLLVDTQRSPGEQSPGRHRLFFKSERRQKLNSAIFNCFGLGGKTTCAQQTCCRTARTVNAAGQRDCHLNGGGRMIFFRIGVRFATTLVAGGLQLDGFTTSSIGFLMSKARAG